MFAFKYPTNPFLTQIPFFMVNKQKSSELLSAVQQIISKSNGQELSEILFKDLKKSTTVIERFAAINPLQSIILSLLVDAGLRDSDLTLNDIINHFNQKIDRVSDIQEAINGLIAKNLISSKVEGKMRKIISTMNFYIEEQVLEAILNGDKKLIETKKAVDFSEFLEVFKSSLYKKRDGYKDAYSLINDLKLVLADCADFKEIAWINSLQGLKTNDILFFIAVIMEQKNGAVNIDIAPIINDLFAVEQHLVSYTRSIVGKTNVLFKLNLIEICEEEYIYDDVVKLSETTLEKLYGNDLKEVDLKKFKPTMGALISPEEIDEETLYYNEVENRQIQTLTKTLQEDNYANVITQLKEHKLGVGINVLLHGFAGTGKTASVKQIAKQTNRALFMVDIEKVQSKWVGDSEKNLKKIFEEYQKLSESTTQTPILLFNEADAILGKRVETKTSIDKSFNTLQNMLLQQLEDFKGISFSTTNLANQLDKAFERRFLYKVEFKKPTKEVQTQILKHSFNTIDNDVIELASSKFSLTGGQISNIKKKLLLQTIIEGVANCNQTFLELCEEELSLDKATNNRVIGFNCKVS